MEHGDTPGRVGVKEAIRAAGGVCYSAGTLCEGCADGLEVLQEKVTTPWRTLRESWRTVKSFLARLALPKKKPAEPDAAATPDNVVELAARERAEALRRIAAEMPAANGTDEEPAHA